MSALVESGDPRFLLLLLLGSNLDVGRQGTSQIEALWYNVY